LFYNIDLFEKSHVPLPTGDWTWEDMRAAAEKLTLDLDGDGRIDQWGLYVPPSSQEGWLNFVWQNGGDCLNADKTRCVLDSPQAVEALQWMQDLTFGDRHGLKRVSPMGGAGSVVGLDLFRQGRLAMCYQGSWMLHEMARSKDVRWDIQVMPARRIDGKLNRAVVTNGLGDCIWKHSPHQQEAWRFMKYLVSMDYHKRIPVIPSRIGAEQSWLARNKTPAHANLAIDMVKYARPIPFTRENALWTDRLDSMVITPVLVSGERTAKEALDRAVPEINKLLDEIHAREPKQ